MPPPPLAPAPPGGYSPPPPAAPPSPDAPPPAPPAPPPAQRQCYLTVTVKDTDYEASDEYIIGTTANGELVHGKCSPSDGAVVDGRGFFECARNVALPPSETSSYEFVTLATDAVDEYPYEGSFVYVEYMVDCEGTCQPPSAPPLIEFPPTPPPPIPPSCSYSATPAGGGNSTNATSTFTDPHAPAPLPPPEPPAAPPPPPLPIAPAPPNGYSPPPPTPPPFPPSPSPVPLAPPLPPNSPPLPPMCDNVLPPALSGATSQVSAEFNAKSPDDVCYLTVNVKATDFDQADEYIIATTANGEQVHGKCSPSDGAVVVDEDNFFECATYVALPTSADGSWIFETLASPGVNDGAFDGNLLYVEYSVSCVSEACTPSPPPSPTSPPPPSPPAMPPPPLAPAPPGGYSPPPPTAPPSPPPSPAGPPPPAEPPMPPRPPPLEVRQCYLTVHVKDTDYDAADEYIVGTYANGELVQGKCSPYENGVEVNGQGFFQCGKYLVLPYSADSTYTFETVATSTVNENPYEGSFVYVEYMVDCEGTCMPPSAPPSLPPPSPLPPTCSYSATPAGGGDSPSATTTFTDPNAPMPLPPPTPPMPPPPPLAPAPPGGYSPPPPLPPPAPTSPPPPPAAPPTPPSVPPPLPPPSPPTPPPPSPSPPPAPPATPPPPLAPAPPGGYSPPPPALPPPPPTSPSPAPSPPPANVRQCYLTVSVKDTDYNNDNEYIIGTTANGEQVHGKCSPSDGDVVDDRGFFVCAKYAELPLSADSTYVLETTATTEVNENAYEGSFVYVEYMVDCEGTCRPPSAPPSPPPLPPTCSYSATPSNGGNGTNATSTFTDPHAPMPLPPPTPPAPPVPSPPPLSPAPPGG